jgi:hypothetical protein
MPLSPAIGSPKTYKVTACKTTFAIPAIAPPTRPHRTSDPTLDLSLATVYLLGDAYRNTVDP